MFHTIEYKGHYIHIGYPCVSHSSAEKVEVQIVHEDGGFDLYRVKSLLAAKRFITKHLTNNIECVQ